MARIPGWSIAVLAASSLVGTASGTSMYAFYPGPNKGAQVGMQDPKTGDIWVNYCNANVAGAPLFPTKNPNVLPTKNKPKIGSSMAATGWWDSQHVIASVFWQSTTDQIVNGFYQCDPESGSFIQQGEYNISDTAQVTSIHAKTGLSVELLGSTAGYRVFYHDEDSQVHQLSYTTKTDWNYYGAVSQDPTFSTALASIHSNTNNITVIFPKSAKDIEVSRYNTDGTWHISAFPETIQNSPTNKTAPSKIAIDPKVTPKFSLPAWTGKPGGLGAAVDNSFTRTAFYIGSDKKLYEIASINFVWQMLPNQSASSWPLADDANAELAVTYNQPTNEAWVYYISNSTLVQAYRGTDGTWGKFTVLPTSVSTPGGGSGDGDSGSGSGDDDNNNKTASAGLSTGAKAGIGIGVSVGAIGVGLLVFLFFLRRRRQRAAALAAEADKEQPPINLGQYHSPSEQGLYYMADGSVAPAYTPQTPYDSPDAVKKSTPDMNMHPANMTSPLVEMEQPPTIYELPPTNFSYELPAESVEHR
ncbi:hypothetical protein TrVFT333_002212 [Trichoderma virens FT-333]|nr:hypothetical protein TrVFT333_002212 [Trichoderma virens FT-333]